MAVMSRMYARRITDGSLERKPVVVVQLGACRLRCACCPDLLQLRAEYLHAFVIGVHFLARDRARRLSWIGMAAGTADDSESAVCCAGAFVAFAAPALASAVSPICDGESDALRDLHRVSEIDELDQVEIVGLVIPDVWASGRSAESVGCLQRAAESDDVAALWVGADDERSVVVVVLLMSHLIVSVRESPLRN